MNEPVEDSALKLYGLNTPPIRHLLIEEAASDNGISSTDDELERGAYGADLHR